MISSDVLKLLGRENELFRQDIASANTALSEGVNGASFLVLGGAGTIGQAVVKEIFTRDPKVLHVVDISENNLVELVRDLRSSNGYINGEFKTYAIDISSNEFEALLSSSNGYDYILNLSALKHVRSEKDPYTLMRLIDVNILNCDRAIDLGLSAQAKKYFCVSTDKASAPINMMGASKRIMEMILASRSRDICVSTARFANVAFSDGSLLHGFSQRLVKHQPIVAPSDIRRYFVTQKEAGELCLMSCILGENNDIFFPKLDDQLRLISFKEIAIRYLDMHGLKPIYCENEAEARSVANKGKLQNEWPCLFSKSDTTGEKYYEEFFTSTDTLELNRFKSIGIVKTPINIDEGKLTAFYEELSRLKGGLSWSKSDLVSLFKNVLPDFKHYETGKYLDGKM